MKGSRYGIIFGLLALILITTGCSSLTGGNWAAKVNGDSVLISDLDSRVALAQKIYEKQGMKFDTDQGKQALTKIKSDILASLVQGKLIAQEVTRQKINPEDAAVKSLEDDFIKKNLGDAAKLPDFLAQQGMTEQELLNFFAVYSKETADVKTPSDADVKAYFDKNIANYSQPESVTAHHILLKTEDDAKKVIAQLQTASKNNTPILPLFEQLAKEKSTEPGAKESGGDLKTFTKGQMVPEFETAAFAQKVGTFSQTPVKTEFGYHVIYVQAHTPAVAADFTKVKSQVEQDALNAAKGTKFKTFYNDLRNKAKIEYAKGYQPAS